MFLATLVWLVLQHKQLLWTVSYNIGMTCVTTQTVALKCFLQHWDDLCYNTNSCFEMFLAKLVWLVLQHKQLLWTVSCNIGMTCVTTQTVGSELFLATLVWLVLQHKQLGLNCFLQHWYDLCYNTKSWSELFLTTLVWLVLQHKRLVWIVSYNIGITCVTTETVSLNYFLQHWYDLCYNTNSWSELFLTTLVWLVLQHKQLVWIVSCNIGMTCVTTQTVALNCFLQHWYDLCYNTNSCFELFLATLVWLVLQHKQCFELFLATLVWLVLQHKQFFWTVSCNIGMTCVTTQTVGLNWTMFLVLQHWVMFLATLYVTTQTVALNCFLQHWYDLCYNTNSWSEMFLTTLVWLVLQHKQLVWIVSYNIGMTCVTTQTVGLNCFLQHWYDLCYNTNSWFELFLTTLNCFLLWTVSTLVWLVLQHKQLGIWTVSCNIGMTCVTTQTVALNCFLQHWYDLCYNTNSWSELFLTTLVWLVLQHKQLVLVWIVSCNIGWLVLQHCLWTVSVTEHCYDLFTTLGLNCFLQHWYDLCYNTNSCSELFLTTLVWLVLQHKQLLWNVSCNIGMTCVTTQTVGSELFLTTWVWLVLQHKQLVLNCFL